MQERSHIEKVSLNVSMLENEKGERGGQQGKEREKAVTRNSSRTKHKIGETPIEWTWKKHNRQYLSHP